MAATDTLVEIQNYHFSRYYEIISTILYMMIYVYYLKLQVLTF